MWSKKAASDIKSGAYHKYSARVLWHSGDLPRSVQRQRRPSKQVWRWKKHVITWLLFFALCTQWGYFRRTVLKSQTTQVWLGCVDTGERLFHVSCKPTRMYNQVRVKNEFFLHSDKNFSPHFFPYFFQTQTHTFGYYRSMIRLSLPLSLF